jgi:hypothetical protein
MKARYCIQCEDVRGNTGDFVFRHTSAGRIPLSPIFQELSDLFEWMKTNGWERDPDNQPFGLVKAKQPTDIYGPDGINEEIFDQV